VVVIFLILGGDRRGDQVRGNAFKRYVSALAGVWVHDLVQDVAVAVEDARRLKLRGAVLQLIHRGQGLGDIKVLVNRKSCHPHHHQQKDNRCNQQCPAKTTAFLPPFCGLGFRWCFSAPARRGFGLSLPGGFVGLGMRGQHRLRAFLSLINVVGERCGSQNGRMRVNNLHGLGQWFRLGFRSLGEIFWLGRDGRDVIRGEDGFRLNWFHHRLRRLPLRLWLHSPVTGLKVSNGFRLPIGFR